MAVTYHLDTNTIPFVIIISEHTRLLAAEMLRNERQIQECRKFIASSRPPQFRQGFSSQGPRARSDMNAQASWGSHARCQSWVEPGRVGPGHFHMQETRPGATTVRRPLPSAQRQRNSSLTNVLQHSYQPLAIKEAPGRTAKPYFVQRTHDNIVQRVRPVHSPPVTTTVIQKTPTARLAVSTSK